MTKSAHLKEKGGVGKDALAWLIIAGCLPRDYLALGPGISN